MVLFCAALSSTTWPRIEAAGRFVVNFMSERGMHLVNRFAMPCADRFENVPHRPGAMGHPVLSEADAYLECELERAPIIGDHAVALGRVVALGGETADSPIIFHRRQLRAVSPLPA
jgi:3-hydroxy-9,10-secoandrosta-1,3,5(10)-triene-9,17-dione monooxygenase reductase component